ncbi:MAG: peptidase S41 [Bacteroidales bacterium]|nr:peptidase S41 [Bacteroidales bacterium]
MKHLCLSIIIGLFALASNAQTTLNKDSLASDFSYLVKLLESTHPDPYSGFGGKVFFYKAANNVVQDLQKNACTETMFVNKVNTFLSNIHDGHTGIQYNKSTDIERYVQRVAFRVIPDGLIVDGISTSHKDLLGARLDSINSVSIAELLKRIEYIYPCENIYGNYNALHWEANAENLLRQLGTEFTDSIRYSLRTADNKSVVLSLPLVNSDSLNNVPITFTPASTKLPSKNLNYQFADKEKHIMVIRISKIMARENYEYCWKNKWDGAYDEIKNYYKYTLKKEMPCDTVKALAGIPSFSEVFANMLTQMKKYKSEDLIIDLRNDGGGWTPITLPSLLMMYGDNYITKDMNTEFYRLISPLYLQKIDTSLDEFNRQQGTHYKLGDYITENDKPSVDTSTDSLRRSFIHNCMSASRPLLTKLKGSPLYHPQHIYVVTDAGTFSAAFHYAFYLWRMGATIVGIPSSQAPNTYMEKTPFCLPYTHLKGSISNSMQIFLPVSDKRAKIFYPDLMPTYQDYKKYDFDANAEILYLLDKIAKQPSEKGTQN